MEYTCTLETLEGPSNALDRHCAHNYEPLEILYALVKVRDSQKFLMIVNKVPGSLYFDF